jgi:hypothetical protein
MTTQEELLKMTKVELFGLASDAKLNPTKSMRKAKLVALILQGKTNEEETAAAPAVAPETTAEEVEATPEAEAEPEAVETVAEEAEEDEEDEEAEDDSGTLNATLSIHADGTHSPYAEADKNGKYPPSTDWPDWEDGQDGYYKCPECKKWAKNPTRHKSCQYWGNVEDHNHVVKASATPKIKATSNLSDEEDPVDPADEIEPEVVVATQAEVVVEEAINLIHKRVVKEETTDGSLKQSVLDTSSFADHRYTLLFAEEFLDEDGKVIKRVLLTDVPLEARHQILGIMEENSDDYQVHGHTVKNDGTIVKADTTEEE